MSSGDQTHDDFEPLPIDMTLVAHHAGEAAVGLSCGAVTAWILRKLQSTLLTVGILGGVGAVAAVHLNWVSVEQVRMITIAISRFVTASVQQLIQRADMDDDGELTIEDSRIAYSRISPLVRKHTAFSGGAVGGFAAVMGVMR